MRQFVQKLFIYTVLILILVVGVYAIFNFSGYGQINFYSFIFSRDVEGVVENVERVAPGMAIVGNGPVDKKDLFSFAVGIKDKAGEIITGTSEDRQWAIVQRGQCAKAKFFPYPPWDLDKSGTYYNVRLLRLYECQSGALTLTTPEPKASVAPPAGAASVATPVPAATAN